MKITRSDAALLTVRERAMLQSSGPWHVRDLVSLIKRLRELRDKQRALGQRQVVASARSKKGKSAAGERSVAKARLLDRALKHFEAELASLDRQSAQAARSLKLGGKPARKAATKKAAVTKSATGKKSKPAATKKSATKKPAAKKATAKKATAKKAAARKAAAKKAAPKQAASKKAAQSSPAKPATPLKALPAHSPGHPPGPEVSISAKARIRLPKGGHGEAPSQVTSLPTLRRRGVRGH